MNDVVFLSYLLLQNVHVGLCPQLQELFHLSTSNEFSLPFPLKRSQYSPKDSCPPLAGDAADITEVREDIALQSSGDIDDKLNSSSLPVGTLFYTDEIEEDTPRWTTLDEHTVEEVGAHECDTEENDDYFHMGRTEQSPHEWSVARSTRFHVEPSSTVHNRRPLFEEFEESNLVSSTAWLPSVTANRGVPIGRHELLYSAAAWRCGASNQLPPNKCVRASPWPTVAVIQDSRVASSGGLFGRYTDTNDIQARLPWALFKSIYQVSMDSFNTTAGFGAFYQRVVIHAHHMANHKGVAAQPLQFGESMPKFSQEELATHFMRAVECTGLNISLLAVPMTCMSLFDSMSSCIYAMKSDVPPLSSFRLMRVCITWLLKEKNVLKCINIKVTGDNNSHLSNSTITILDAFCKAIVSGDATATLSLGPGASVSQRLLMYKKHLVRLDKNDEYEMLKFVNKFSLSGVFVQVLCELYCETITVVDFVRRAVKTYTSSNGVKKETFRNLFIYQVDSPIEYYYGLIDNDKCMKNA